MANQKNEEEILRSLRKEVFINGYKGGMAHLASCFSSIEIIYTLYIRNILHIDPKNPKSQERDRFVLSKGHAGLALYAVLRYAGLISDAMFESYLHDDAQIGGEPCMRDCEWIEATTGSLGHGLSMSVGMAMALKMDKSSAKVYCMLGDGECEEGSVWEAAMSAAAFKLDNLTAILDSNRIQKTDLVENIIGSANWKERWEAFGWTVRECDGHDIQNIYDTLSMPAEEGRPVLVIAHTVKGKGVSVMEDNPNWHFKLPNKKEMKIFKTELDVADSELE